MRDYFSEEILGQKPKRDYFAEEILGEKEQERDYFAEEVGGALPEEEEPTFTKALKGLRSVRDVGREVLKGEEPGALGMLPMPTGGGIDLALAKNIATLIPRFGLSILSQPHAMVKMMEEEPPPPEKAVEEFVGGIPLVGAGYRVAKGEGKELLKEYYKEPERLAMEALMPLFMKHIFTQKLPPTKPALPRPSIPGQLARFEEMAKPKKKVLGKAEEMSAEEMSAIVEELRSVGSNVNPDGTVTLYHATTKGKLKNILKEKVLRKPSDAPDTYGVYAGTDVSVTESYGDGTVIKIKVPLKDLHPDDIFPGRRMDFRIETKRGIYKPLNIEEILPAKPKKPVPGAEEMKLAKIKANVEIDSFVDYFESIQAPKEFRPPRKPARTAIGERLREEGLRGKELTLETNVEFIKAVHDYGIALRKTKGGRVQPTIREAGTYVPEDFATYTEFKDAKAGVFGGTKDATRFIQEIDGVLSVEAKAKLPGQAGPVEQYVLHRTRDMVKFKLNWTNAMKSRLATITKNSSKKQLQIANQVIEHISREGAYVDPAKLVTNPKISALTTDVNVIRLAQEGRKLYESLLRHQNELRRLRGQKEIPHRDYYTAHSIHETTIWERALGHNKTPEQIIGPGLPDYIKPNAPFNPRAMAREFGLPETAREMNLKVLLERYIETAAKDIYNTSIVQNNKAFIQQLKSMGYEHAARGLENWTAEAFTGVRAAVDRVANLSPTIHKGMNRFRRGLLRSVFPLNFAWNTFVQTSSGVLTVTRYGLRNSVRGLYDWFGNKKIRQEIRDNAYSAIIKSQRSGRISRQDINRGIGAAERLSRGKLEKASDAANFFTEWVERHLTGWSVATAKRHGASVGLKGKALWEYASDGGAKTQSMYNLEDLPGMLRSEVVKTTAPFQTFSFEIYNTLKEFAGKTGTPPATTAIRIKMVLRFLAGATAVNYIGQAAIGRKPWELSSFIPFYGTFLAPISAALRGKDVSMTTTRGLPSPVGIAIKGGQAVHKGLLRPGFAATKEFARTRDFRAALEEFMATGKWDKLRRFTIRYLSGFAGIPGGTQMNRIVDGLIATSAGGMVDSADRLMFPITDTKDKIRSFLAGPWSTKGGQEYWDKRGKELNLDIEFLEENPLLRDVVESFPVFGDFYKFRKDSESQTRQNIKRMLRTGNTKSAYRERFEWNMENPDKKISREWYSKQLREVIP